MLPRRPRLRTLLPVTAAALMAPLLAAPAATGAATGTATGVGATAVSARSAVPPRGIVHTRWDAQRQLSAGAHRGTRAIEGRLEIAEPTGARTRGGTRYDAAHWRSPWVQPGFRVTELIPSWQARTPRDSWVQVDLRVRAADGRVSSWDTLGQWSNGDTHVQRRSITGQSDDLGAVAADTWRAASGADVRQWQVRVVLLRRAGTRIMPTVDAVGAVASRLPDDSVDVPTSTPGPAAGTALRLPRWSQYTHTGHYRQWGGGGEAWCSPTSISMVLGYWGRLPRRREYRFVPSDHPQPWVDHAARYTYDHGYGGTGNWAFGTAYAALRGTDAFVTRLRSLREAERFIAAGIPLVASIAFRPGELTNAPLTSSAGHLLVVSGFTASGDVRVHDPAGADYRAVRRTYDRAEFERLWLRASGGMVYVIRGEGTPLPERHRNRNW